MTINDKISVNRLMFSIEECYWCYVLCEAYGTDVNGKYHGQVYLSIFLEKPTIEDLKTRIIEEFNKKVNQED